MHFLSAVFRMYTIPKVFGLKLMSFNAGYDRLLTINCFPIYLQHIDVIGKQQAMLSIMTILF